MTQQNSLAIRSRNVRTVFVWVALAFLMSVGSAQAASTGSSNGASDRTVSMPWQFVYGDPIAVCIPPSGYLFAAHPSMGSQLEAAAGASASYSTLSAVIDDLAPASSGAFVRFEGGAPDDDAVSALAAKGYTNAVPVPPSPGFASAVEYRP